MTLQGKSLGSLHRQKCNGLSCSERCRYAKYDRCLHGPAEAGEHPPLSVHFLRKFLTIIKRRARHARRCLPGIPHPVSFVCVMENSLSTPEVREVASSQHVPQEPVRCERMMLLIQHMSVWSNSCSARVLLQPGHDLHVLLCYLCTLHDPCNFPRYDGSF